MVCFDAGGVLVRICRTWRERCEQAGVEYRWDAEVEAQEAARHEAHSALERGLIGEDAYFEAIGASTRGLYTSEELHAIHVAWIIGEYPGVRELVERLRGVPGVSTGLLSNTNAIHWATPYMYGSADSAVRALEHPHASHLLGLTKPGTEIYRAYERETGFAAGEILFFDDTEENIDAARSVGWRAERIDHTGDTVEQVVGHLASHSVHLPPSG